MFQAAGAAQATPSHVGVQPGGEESRGQEQLVCLAPCATSSAPGMWAGPPES
ncbi:LIM domain containing 2, isoform CRA_b [Mus musculus]|nr:LIM domain containing 2, isoform CRA_b [Mus musculus]